MQTKERVNLILRLRHYLNPPPPPAPKTFAEMLKNTFSKLFVQPPERRVHTWRDTYAAVEVDPPISIFQNIWNLIEGLGISITFGDLITMGFFVFGLFVAYQFYKKEGVFSTTRAAIDTIPSDHLQKHIKNVSTLIDQMHESHSQITRRMWELQVPLTMVKYRAKMMDEIFADAGGDSAHPALPERSERNNNAH